MLQEVEDWKIKTYTITHRRHFESKEILDNALASLPEWLKRSSDFLFPNYKSAFLIVHEGRDGVWSLIHWWIGGEMLQGQTFFTPYTRANRFELKTDRGLWACVWELAVISFEREMWIEHILKNAGAPDFEGYLQSNMGKCVLV